MWRSTLIFVLLVLATATTTTNAVYLTKPTVEWTVALSDGLLQGNAVVNVNDQLLAATTTSGALHFVSKTTTNGTAAHATMTFTPNAVSGMDATACASGIIVINNTNVSDHNGTVLLLYVVVDTDSTKTNAPSSRILAVTTTTAKNNHTATIPKLVWSVTLPGTVAGTPVLSQMNNILYVVHNTAQGNVEQGVVTVLQWKDAVTTPTVVKTLPSQSTGVPFAAPAPVVTTAAAEDVIFFGQAGFGSPGALFAVTGNNGKFNFITAYSAIATTNAAPAVSAALEVYLGQADSTVVGWTNGDQTALLNGGAGGGAGGGGGGAGGGGGGNVGKPTWAYVLQTDPNNPINREYLQPLANDIFGVHAAV